MGTNNIDNVIDFDNYKTIYTNIDREITVLSGVLSNNFSPLEFTETFRSEWFGSDKHQSIAEAIKELYLSKQSVNPLTVSTTLEGLVSESYITRMANNFIPCGELKNYKRLLKDNFIKRQIKEALEISDEVLSNSEPEVALSELKRFIDEIGVDVSDEEKTSNTEAQTLAIQQIKDEQNGLTRGVPTGIDSLDRITKGLSATEFVVVAARPGMGKSALATSIANNVAFKEQKPVLYYTLEMNHVDLMKRILMCEAKTPVGLSQMQDIKVPEHYRILYKPSLTLEQLRTSIIKERASLGCDPALIVVDHLGLIRVPKSRSFFEATTLITHELKALAGEFNTCVMGLSQLNREVEKRESKMPSMSDLKNSGSIEEDADEVWLLYRPDYYSDGKSNNNQAVVNIGKNRDGATGLAQLIFNPRITLFS